jgi:hypothetical protein
LIARAATIASVVLALALSGCAGIPRSPCLDDVMLDADGTRWLAQRDPPVQALNLLLLLSVEENKERRRYDWYASDDGRLRLYASPNDTASYLYEFAARDGRYVLTRTQAPGLSTICVHD